MIGEDETVLFTWEDRPYKLQSIIPPDVEVVFVNGMLHHVTPPVAPGHRGDKFKWQSVPANEAHEYIICIKEGFDVPFSDWNSRCRESQNGVVEGTIKEYLGLNGYIDIKYSVIDLGNLLLLDPIIRVN